MHKARIRDQNPKIALLNSGTVSGYPDDGPASPRSRAALKKRNGSTAGRRRSVLSSRKGNDTPSAEPDSFNANGIPNFAPPAKMTSKQKRLSVLLPRRSSTAINASLLPNTPESQGARIGGGTFMPQMPGFPEMPGMPMMPGFQPSLAAMPTSMKPSTPSQSQASSKSETKPKTSLPSTTFKLNLPPPPPV